MFKKGFTLQELLISMAIVGIVAAIAAPGIVGMIPDKKKTMYMKAYNTLTTLTNDILDDPSLYWTTYDNDGEPECHGLNCWEEVAVDGGGTYAECNVNWRCSQAHKFSAIFATKVNFNERRFIDDEHIFVRTTDGVTWDFMGSTIADPNNNGGRRLLRMDVTIDVNPDNDNAANKCTYSDGCTDPDLFTFRIDNDGGIIAVDPLGQAFLRNPTDMHSVSEDKEIADDLEEAVNDFVEPD